MLNVISSSTVINRIGITYSVAELDERGDSPGSSPARHMLGLIYQY